MIHWKFFTDAGDETKARKVLGWVLDRLQLVPLSSQIEPYHKGGFVLLLSFSRAHTGWPDTVVETLIAAERVGRGWNLSGSIARELEIHCNESIVPGVTFVHVHCAKDGE